MALDADINANRELIKAANVKIDQRTTQKPT